MNHQDTKAPEFTKKNQEVVSSGAVCDLPVERSLVNSGALVSWW
jgi:hypothetical protein